MGYTHYYQLKKNDPELFAEAVKLFKEKLENLPSVVKEGCVCAGKPITLKGWDGHGDPIIEVDEVRFNGDADTQDDYESFSLVVDDLEWNFCKTAKQPYDVAVYLCLLCFKKVYGKGFTFSSDGDHKTEEIKFAMEVFGE